MEITETGLDGCIIIKPTIYGDERGYFFESYNNRIFREKTGFNGTFVQDNQSFSTYGVIRGLHAQRDEFAQSKLVRVLKGVVLDVAVDIRPGSVTYGKHVSVILSEENKHQLLVPRGFLHGFAVLSAEAEFFYKCDNFYNKHAEFGVRYDDKSLGIDWKIPTQDAVISEKDLVLPGFNTLTV